MRQYQTPNLLLQKLTVRHCQVPTAESAESADLFSVLFSQQSAACASEQKENFKINILFCEKVAN